MKEYTISYKTENSYDKVVLKAVFQLLIIPVSNRYQTIKNIRTSTNLNIPSFSSKNHFGFELINYRIEKPFDKFVLDLCVNVAINTSNPYDVNLIDRIEEEKIIHSPDFKINNYLFIQPTVLTTISQLDLKAFPIKSIYQNLFEYLTVLNTYIHTYMTYKNGVTTNTTTVNDILANPTGVCQDYAHLFIAICRAQHYPVRYCSGYLNQGDNFVGGHQLHAWVEVLLPSDKIWKGFDPTNNLLVDVHYIKIAHGLDYNCCSAIKGVLQSDSPNNLSLHEVKIINQ